MRKNPKVFKMTLIGVMAALVFVSSMASIPIPISIGDVSRIHLGNIACLLSGFILGGVGGGLAAGIGSALYDLTNPAYITSAPFTFVFKFLMAFICGCIAYGGGRNALRLSRNITAAILGNLTYVFLYVGKGFLNYIWFLDTELQTALIFSAEKLAVSMTNLLIACVISVPLALLLKKTLRKAHLDIHPVA